MSEFLEACMVVSFGISWPMNIIKSLRTRSAKGKSLCFLLRNLFQEISPMCLFFTS